MEPIHESHLPSFPQINKGPRAPKQALKASTESPTPQQLQPPFDQSGDPELERVCSEFASIFSYVLIKNMRSTIPKSSFFQEVQGKNLVDAMTDQKMAQYLSSQNGFGIKELLLKSVIVDDNINHINSKR